MTSKVAAVAALTLTLLPRLALAQHVETDRVTEAARVLEEILSAPDKGVPEAIVEKAQAVVVNERGIDNLAQNTFKIGGDASVAAGPVGREAAASTDYKLQAQILSYSRSRGLFAGVSLAGSTIRADRDANEKIYGVGYSTRNIVVERKVEPTAAAEAWLKVLKEKM